jgi:DNA-binding XRE family transcriptional regulator
MPPSFADFISELDAEAHADGPDAITELHALRLRFSLARQLVTRRHERQLTQKQLASLSSISQSAISRIERGQADLSMATLAALTRALEVDVRLVER